MNWCGKCEGPSEGDRRGALCTGFTLVMIKVVNDIRIIVGNVS